MSRMIRAKFEVTGFVQGVGFRYFAMREAMDLGVTGYVKNCYDGSVCIVAEGDEDSMALFRSRMRSGPARARVEMCSVEYEDYRGEFTNFVIR